MKTNAAAGRCPWGIALVPRTAALFIILFQICLAAGDLADVPFFAVGLLGALVIAAVIFGKGFGPFQALAVIGLVPWALRFFIAAPRWFLPRGWAWIELDALLLDLDRNYFAVLLPFYWTALTTFFSLKSRAFLRAEIISADILFIGFFSVVPAASMEAYRWPVLLIFLFGLVFFLQILAFIFSMPPEFKLRKTEKSIAAAAAFILVAAGCLLFIRPSQEQAVEQGGGLLEPNLFRFDFSQFLRLDPEISMNNDLVLIAKKDADDSHILLRRYTLSGYTREGGFFRQEVIDEKTHPQKLPVRRTLLDDRDEIELYREVKQEYYLVNFDSSAFIGMNMPVEIVPYEVWDSSSFNSVYEVTSYASEAYPMELYDAVGADISAGRGFSAADLGLAVDDYSFYTDYGDDSDYTEFAETITRGARNYWEKIDILYDFLKYGEYRYSLKPGIAPDGDQLKYFLFESKKGYCSYYAFAFALMLRSLGIPCRVAAGFFIDTESGAFGYYPVRANMAHAWVEVWFPRYGWIEYDPTSEEMAPGEEFFFGTDTQPELFEGLLKEILDNRSRLRVREYSETGGNNFSQIGRETALFLRNRGPFLLAVLVLLLSVFYRCRLLLLSGVSKKPAAKAGFLWAHTLGRLGLLGIKKPRNRGEAEWAAALSDSLYALYKDSAAARFDPAYSENDFSRMKLNYRAFDSVLRENTQALRRFAAWLCPLVRALPAPLFARAPNRKAAPSRGAKTVLLVLFVSLFFSRGEAQDAPPPDDILNMAIAAVEAENWERAVEVLTLGSNLYPDNINFPYELGNLFYGRRLFHLAWNEYLRCEQISPNNFEIFFQLARTAAYLNLNESSAEYLEKVLRFLPDDREAIGSLAWIYYKLHRYQDGERLLLSAIERLGDDPDFSMTLGTLYSDMFNYDEAKIRYLDAIAGAQAAGDWLFSAVAHYNLSILESRFYQYDFAYEQANLSLDSLDRASGRLARGELFLRRMDIAGALAEYQEAYSMDTSPLSKLNLAEVYQIAGKLREARLYAEDCLKLNDETWMLNYGIDPVRYKMDVHEILEKTYAGLANAEQFRAPENFWDGFSRILRSAGYRFRAAVHGHLFRKYCVLAAKAYGPADFHEIHLDALALFQSAFEPYPRRSLDYLRGARGVEEPLIPGSAPSYDLEEARLFGGQHLAARALEGFDGHWEQDMIADAWVELAAGGPYSRQAAAELYAINPGALGQYGIVLEVNLRLEGIDAPAERVLVKAVKAAGIRPVLGTGRTDTGGEARYTLVLSAGAGGINCRLSDREQQVPPRNITLPDLSSVSEAGFSRALGEAVFGVF